MSQIDWEGYDDEVGDPWKTDCSACGEWMKMSFNDVLACPICDMADERYDPQIERPVVWPNVYGLWPDDEEGAA